MHGRSITAALLAALLGSLLLVGAVGCSTAQTPAADSTSSSTAPALSTSRGPNDAEASLPPVSAPATADATSTAAAVEVAHQAMTNFARPTLDADTWFTELAPLLSETARGEFVGTDPAEVPTRAVTGAAVPQASPSAYLAYVSVPTDVGDYRLLLSREGGDTAWLVETITPPAGVQ